MSTDRAVNKAAQVIRDVMTGPGTLAGIAHDAAEQLAAAGLLADQSDHAETLGALNRATRERDEARAVLRDIADRGLRADLTPTVTSAMDPGGTYRELTAYLRRLDARIRERARRALERSTDE